MYCKYTQYLLNLTKSHENSGIIFDWKCEEISKK